ncbi:MAG: MMPL family protein [Methanomassiliicoccales archaeon PtaU1.Bin124]|nr:MAG: MMPL family protein [Methanomassiliicoccales archaeon PtaU1.Bin124]
MVFDKLANTITKHYKMVLILWVILLVISVPAIMQVNEVVKYESTGVTTGDYDSVKASNIITEEFGSSVANGTLIILLQSDNMTDAAARNYVLALQDKIEASNKLKGFEGIATAYSVAQMVMDQTVIVLGPNMKTVESQVNTTAFLIWGLPALHASNWAITHSDPDTFNMTEAQILYYLQQQGANQTEVMMTMGYYHAFTDAWNATAINPALVADPSARATYCVEHVAPVFINSLPLPAEQKLLMVSIVGSFNLTTFNNQVAVHSFTLGVISVASSITNMTFLEQVYQLPSYSYGAVHNYTSGIIRSGTLYTYPVQVPAAYMSNLLSPSNKTMLISMSFSYAAEYVAPDGDKPMIDNVGYIRDIITETKTEQGYRPITYVTGSAAISADTQESTMKDLELIEPITIAIIIILMGILFRSVLAQWLPLGAVGVALGISTALVFVIGSTVASIDSTVLTMLFSILMGVGTDYSIFIVTRYREERIKGATREQAVHTSITWAGESIVTSGATVIIAFFAMATANFSMVQTMGLTLGMAIIVALLVALTLVPAILMLVGNRIFWPNTGERWKKYATAVIERKKAGNHGYFHRAASFAVKHAKMIVAISIIISIPTTYIYLTAEPSFDFISSMGHSESIDGMNAMTDDFGAGAIMPTQIIVTGDTYVYQNGQWNIAYLNALENLTANIDDNSIVQSVTSVTRPYGTLVDYRNLSSMNAELRTQVETGMLACVGNTNRTVLMTVVLVDQPESAASVDFISHLRGQISDFKVTQPDLASSTVLVGGTTASLYDLSTSITTQFTNIEIIVVIGIFIVLMIVLGSLLLPLFAVVSIAMSISWAFALVYLVFGQWLGQPILFIVPLILFIMLMGIGMDYNVFILTRIREEVHKGKENDQAVIDAVDWTGGIITALALIMGGAFASMMLSSNAMLLQFGFALAVAILLDAMVVRTYIVPAAMSLMGKWAWWAPGRLQREGRADKVKKQ